MARSERDGEGKQWMTAIPTKARGERERETLLADCHQATRPGLGELASEVEGRAVSLLLALHDVTGAGHTAKEEPTPTPTNRLEAIMDRLTRASAVLAEALAFVEREIAGKL